MEELSTATGKQTAHPDGLFIIAGDLNHSNLQSALPKFHQNVSCPTRGDKTLDHAHTNIADAYKAAPLPHLGQSDHVSLFLLPKYVSLIKRVKTSTKTVKVWTEGASPLYSVTFRTLIVLCSALKPLQTLTLENMYLSCNELYKLIY